MSIRWIKDGEPHSAEVYNRPLRDYIQEAESKYASRDIDVKVSNGLTGGGKLIGNVEIKGLDATTTQKGVVRFATLAEANSGAQGVVVSPDVVKNMTGTGLGSSQKWKRTTKQKNITYRNELDVPIIVGIHNVGRWSVVGITVDGIRVYYSSGDNQNQSGNAVVPPGSTYVFTGNGSFNTFELS